MRALSARLGGRLRPTFSVAPGRPGCLGSIGALLLCWHTVWADPVAPGRVWALSPLAVMAPAAGSSSLDLAAAGSREVGAAAAGFHLPASEQSYTAPQAPLWKAWWVWTATGLAVGGVIAGLAIGLTPRASAAVSWTP